MKRLYPLLFVLLLIWSCEEKPFPEHDITPTEVALWGAFYSIEETDSLNLSNSGLKGIIPLEIGNLTNLTTLHLGSNQLTGSIPSEISNLINLKDLSLDNNQLTGLIPTRIGDLINLRRIFLENNQLTGPIPPGIGNLTNLYYFNLTNNQLTGDVPDSICNLDWNYSSINSNQLCPPYPSCIENFVGEQDTSNCN